MVLAALFLALWTASASAATLSGHVSEPEAGNTGNLLGIFEAQVDVTQSSDGTQVASTTTGLNGAYSVPVPTGTFDITVTPPLASGLRTVVDRDESITADKMVNVMMVRESTYEVEQRKQQAEQRRHSFSGVLRTASGEPVANATVWLPSSSCGSWWCSSYGSTNAAGEFSFPLSTWTGAANVDIEGALPVGGAHFKFESTGEPIRLSGKFHENLTLPATNRLTLEPRDAEGQPVAMTAGGELSCPKLSLAPGVTGAGRASPPSGASDAIGLYHFDCPGTQNITLTGEHLTTLVVPVATPAADTTQQVSQPSSSLSGVLHGKGGVPLAGVAVSAGLASTTTAANGSFTMQIASGHYQLQVTGSRPAGVAKSAAPESFSFSAEVAVEEQTHVDLTLPLRQASYHVLGQGKPVPGVMLSLSGGGPPQSQEYLAPGIPVTSASSSAQGLETNGSGTATATVPSAVSTMVHTDPAASREVSGLFFLPAETTVGPAQENIALSTYPNSFGVAFGIVRYPSGEPLAGVSVGDCSGSNYSLWQCGNTTSNARGEYVLIFASGSSCPQYHDLWASLGSAYLEKPESSNCEDKANHVALVFPKPEDATVQLKDSSQSVALRPIWAECSDSYSTNASPGETVLGGSVSLEAYGVTDGTGRATVSSYEGHATCRNTWQFGEFALSLAPEPALNIWEVPNYTFSGTLKTTTGTPVANEELTFCIGAGRWGCEEELTSARAVTTEAGKYSANAIEAKGDGVRGWGGTAGSEAQLELWDEEASVFRAGVDEALVVTQPPETHQWVLEAQDAAGTPVTGVSAWSWAEAVLYQEGGGVRVRVPGYGESSWYMPYKQAAPGTRQLPVEFFGPSEAGYVEDRVQTPYWSGALGGEEVNGEGKEIVALTGAVPGETPPETGRPVVSGVSIEGSSRSYAQLAVAGEGLEEASAVHCGSEAAIAFSVESATAIMVRCRPGSGSAHVTVTGPGGTSEEFSGSLFTYPAHPTGPTVTCATASVEWHKENVTVACTASDSLSGLAHPEEASFTLATSVGVAESSTAAYTGSRTVCNKEGLCEEAGPVGPFKIDRKPPTVTVSSPANGLLVLKGASLAARYSCADEGSGVASCEGMLPSGQAINTATPGEYTFAVGATDRAGNSTSRIVRYTVVEGGECGAAQLCQVGPGDSQPPKVIGLTRSPESVNTASAAQSVSVSVQATDTLSGTEAVQVSLTNGSRVFSAPAHLQSGGTGLNGTWDATVTLAQGAPKGVFVLSVAVVDAAGNAHVYSGSELLALGLPYTVEQTGEPAGGGGGGGGGGGEGGGGGGAPPAVTAVTASVASVNTCGSSQPVSVNVAASDSPTSVSGVLVRLYGPGGQQATGYATLQSGTAHAGTWSAALSIPQYSRQGTWAIAVQAWDSSRAETYLASAQLAGAGFTSAIQQECPGDETPPEVKSVSLSPTSIDTLAESQTVSVEVHASDDLSGVASLAATLSSGSQHLSAPAELRSGTRLNGYWVANVTVPRWSPQGTWHLSLSASDAMGNTMSVSVAEPTLMQTGETDSQPPSVLSGSIVPARIDTESEPRQVQVRMRATDNLSGVARVLVRFTAPDGQVVEGTGSLEEGGSVLEGTWQVNLTFPRYSDEGAWQMQVEAWDAFGNHIAYSPSQLSSIFPPVRDARPPRPTITGISPAYARSAGGSPITINGTGFEEVTGVTFGGVNAVSYTVSSNRSITAVAPEGSGTVAVRVSNEFATSPLGSQDELTFIPPGPAPSVSALSSKKGPVKGGTTVTITGKEFKGITAVTFGSLSAASYTVTSETSITAVSPPGASGTVDLRVTNPNGTSGATPLDHFKYEYSEAPPEFGRCTKVESAKVGAKTVYDGMFTSSSCTAASSTVTGQYEWEPGAAKAGFKTTIKPTTKATLETVKKVKVVCTGESSAGAITSAKTVGSVAVKFTGCVSGTKKCTTAGLGEGELETKTLEGVLGIERITIKEGKETRYVALDLYPVGRTGAFLEYTCTGSSPTTLSGSILAPVTADKMLATATLKFTATAGKQKPEAFLGGEEDVLTNTLSEQVGLTVGSTQTNEEAVEINAWF